MKSIRDICAILVESNVIASSDIVKIESLFQREPNVGVVSAVVKACPSVTMTVVMRALSQFYSIPILDISAFDLSIMLLTHQIYQLLNNYHLS